MPVWLRIRSGVALWTDFEIVIKDLYQAISQLKTTALVMPNLLISYNSL